MSLYVSKPTLIEAVQWTGDLAAVEAFAGDKVALERVTDYIADEPATDERLTLLAGKDGAQEWVPVPEGHWLVSMPGDRSDIWPVDAGYFAAKYEPAEAES